MNKFFKYLGYSVLTILIGLGLIIIVIGVIVGVIMISMYAPMFDLSKIINN